jgi:hypothetical protein
VSWEPIPPLLDRLLVLWLRGDDQMASVGFAFNCVPNFLRSKWVPKLTEENRNKVRKYIEANHPLGFELNHTLASLTIAYHAKDILSDEELAKALYANKDRPFSRAADHLKQFAAGRRILASNKSSTTPR